MTDSKHQNLTQRFDKLLGPRPRFSFECDDGWYYILNDTLQEFQRVVSTYQLEENAVVITCIKQKFGGLRIYFTVDSTLDNMDEIQEELWDITKRAEERSTQTCEITGDKGLLRELNWEYKTVSDNEYRKWQKKQ